MRTETLKYHPRGKPIPDGWELVADFDDCHHGRYSRGIIRKMEPERCPACSEEWEPLEVHGHISCAKCKTVVSTCCPGAGNGESG